MSTDQKMAPWREEILRTWVLSPLGVLIILYFVVGVDSLIELGTVAFPASVACLLFLFSALLAGDVLLPEKYMRMALRTIDLPMGFALRTMALYFTPNFVMLPASKPVDGAQIGTLTGVFVVGYVVQLAVTAYICQSVQALSKRFQASNAVVLEGTDANGRLPVIIDSTAEDDVAPMGRRASEQDRAVIDVEAARLVEPQKKPDTAVETLKRWLTLLLKDTDRLPYWILLLIGFPIAYAASYTMPLFLSLNVLIFHAVNSLRPKIKRIANPVLITGLTLILIIYLFGLTTHLHLAGALKLYRTNTSYKLYLRGLGTNLPLPGAGDLLAALLDASIVALALPMFQHRRELRRHFAAIVAPVVILTAASLFGYPALCAALGVEPAVSLAVAPRSVTLALAQLSTVNLGGSVDVVSVLAVVSGICGPIFGMAILRLLRVPKDDFVTVGVVMGANSSAIATAMLLEKDRRAAALSSLAMTSLGLLFVILTIIPPVSQAVQRLVGL